MRICPKCKNTFADDLNFCLEDGTALEKTVNFNSFGEPETVSKKIPQTSPSENPTVPFQAPNRATQTSQKSSFAFKVVVGISLLLLLMIPVIAFGVYYIASNMLPKRDSVVKKKPARYPEFEATPEQLTTMDVKIVGKVKDNFGTEHFKCIVENTGNTIISNPSVTINFFEGDVRVDDVSGTSKLEYLKPGQKVPIWTNFPPKEKYTEARNGSREQRASYKTEKELYPKVEISKTKMTTEIVNSSYNYRIYKDTRYIVSGIVENQSNKEISPDIFVLYYDEKDEIVGIGSTTISSIKQNEKSRFETNIGLLDTYGKPKTFEIITIDD